ncbi:hypothetical protein ACQFN5_29765 (plasmid) [Klebsiella sp. WOUb02]
MKKLSEMLKAAASSKKPVQKVKGKDLYSGAAGPGNSNAHCQGGGGW